MHLEQLAKSKNPPPVLVIGGMGGSGYQAALQAAREWSNDSVIDWGNAKVVMNEQPAEGQLSIRDLRSALNLKPGAPQAVVLNLDGAGVEVQNALLKRFEEPTSDTWIIAIVSSLNYVLPTIRSRCQLVRIQPLDQEQLNQWITDKDLQISDEVVALCSQDLDCILWCSENPQLAQAAIDGDIASLLAALRESGQAAVDTRHMLHLLGASGQYHTQQAQQILKRGGKPEAALALASLTTLQD